MSKEAIVPISDFIHGGLYSRTAFASAGTIIVGLPHKTSGIAYLLSGIIQQIDGDNKYEVSAPHIIRTDAGTSRVAKALTDCIYSTVHISNSNSVEEAEKELFEGMPQLTRIRNSFKQLIDTLNINEETISVDMAKMGHIVEQSDTYIIKPSAIHGLGCFALSPFLVGDPIAVAVKDGNRLGTARYVNHSDIPNCKFIDFKDSVMLIATSDIGVNEELLVDYQRRLICQQ